MFLLKQIAPSDYVAVFHIDENEKGVVPTTGCEEAKTDSGKSSSKPTNVKDVKVKNKSVPTPKNKPKSNKPAKPKSNKSTKPKSNKSAKPKNNKTTKSKSSKSKKSKGSKPNKSKKWNWQMTDITYGQMKFIQ